MKKCFFFLAFSFLCLWSLFAEEGTFFRVELHENFFSAEYSPEIFEWYAALLGKDFSLVEKPPRNLYLKSCFYLCSRKGMASPGWEGGSVTGADFTVEGKGVRTPCSAVAEVRTFPFSDGIAWCLFEIRITGPVSVVRQYGVAVRRVMRNGCSVPGITGDVRGFPASRLLISSGMRNE